MSAVSASPFARITDAFDRLTSREQRLVLIAGAAVTVFVFAAVVLGTLGALDAKAKRVEIKRGQLDQILSLEDAYKQAEAEEKRAIQRLKSNNISLFSLLQKTAQQLGLTLNDLNERKLPVKDAEDVTEINVEVNLNKVSIDRLNQFLEAIEGKSKSGLVKIIKLKVKTRFDDPDLLDVNMTVATWTTTAS